MKKLIFLLLMAHSSWAQFRNITLAVEQEGIFPPLEPSIAINPRDQENIIAGVAVDRAIYSLDGGITWRTVQLQSPYGVKGDPALIFDAKGDAFFFHLSDPSNEGRKNDAWLDRIVVNTSTDKGKSWDEGESIGHNPPKDQDKPWPGVHPKKQFMAVSWTQFDKYGVADTTCKSNILISFSENGGKKWTKPKRINGVSGNCLDDDETAEGAVPVINQDGRIFVAWSSMGYIVFDRSYDGGERWLSNDLAIAHQYGGWNMTIPGLKRANGLPVLAIDNSPSRFGGSLYICYADQKNGTDDTDIWLIRSTNYGDNWSQPLRINKDGAGKHQFFPWMAIDQATGYIYIVYYDRRDYDDTRTDVYLAYSRDGGSSFKEMKISESPFVPDPAKFFGDYNNIAAHKGIITPIWTRMDNGKTSVLTSVIKDADLK
jgi:hypothetical protein